MQLLKLLLQLKDLLFSWAVSLVSHMGTVVSSLSMSSKHSMCCWCAQSHIHLDPKSGNNQSVSNDIFYNDSMNVFYSWIFIQLLQKRLKKIRYKVRHRFFFKFYSILYHCYVLSNSTRYTDLNRLWWLDWILHSLLCSSVRVRFEHDHEANNDEFVFLNDL